MMLDKFIALSGPVVFTHHFGHEFLEGGLGCPTKLCLGLGLGRVAQEGLNFGWAEVAQVDGNDELVAVGGFPVAFFVTPSPSQ